MDKSIQSFRFERYQLKLLKVNDGNEQRKNITFIKGEILDMQDKFNDVFTALTNQMTAFSSMNTVMLNLREEQNVFQN